MELERPGWAEIPYLRNLQGKSIRCDTESDGKASITEYGIFLLESYILHQKKKKKEQVKKPIGTKLLYLTLE